jgi:hypothetical protein
MTPYDNLKSGEAADGCPELSTGSVDNPVDNPVDFLWTGCGWLWMKKGLKILVWKRCGLGSMIRGKASMIRG